MSKISSKAEVHKKAVIGKNVTIGPYSIIEENVKIGDNTVIGPFVHIKGWTDIGKRNEIHQSVSIGDKPQDLSYQNERSYVNIGDNNIFREFVTIHRGTKAESKTIIKNNNMFMVYSHVGHNAVVHNNVIMVNSSSLGGYVEVNDNCFISACAQIHQFCKIGRYAMIAPLTKPAKDVPPFIMVIGADPAKAKGLNVIALRRAEISADDREYIKEAYKTVYLSSLNVSDAKEAIRKNKKLYSNQYVKEFVDFIDQAERGICGYSRK